MRKLNLSTGWFGIISTLGTIMMLFGLFAYPTINLALTIVGYSCSGVGGLGAFILGIVQVFKHPKGGRPTLMITSGVFNIIGLNFIGLFIAFAAWFGDVEKDIIAETNLQNKKKQIKTK